ncbi:dipeptidyl aminopeptidase/acylaminoacyl peptidase [Cryobacterium mesophilum]|uniref:S9 family peptidase n=1 Tax=Terrimesophilobacter mesophilus TaxID=433647 RepID=A0A4R8V8A3_9MICO|nr:S9 family peptidase [Terrimesophilobacter mesophilus]MBB5632013.1 dipeptidyl aminopeptidase/acylaminoacyl peptidase [Terrimesophilobacter mesophilus]TFB78903.1 S9 family peptidase [Terrimesophilobacter mesophilus]
MKPTDLLLLTSVSRPTIHPDGTWAVFATSSPNLDADAYVGQLWRVALDGTSAPVRITRGFSDGSPRFSPDGTRIAFLRSDGENPPQLQVVSAAGGEPSAATNQKLGVSSFEWSPDSSKLAYTARVAEEGRYGTVKDLGAGAEPPRKIVTRKYQSNGLGYTTDRRNHIFLVEAPDPAAEPSYTRAPSADEPTPEQPSGVPESRQITTGDFDDGYLRFSVDGVRVGFVSARHDDRDVDLANNIYEVSIEDPDAEPVALTGSHGKYGIDGFAYAPDGTVYFVGSDLGERGRDFVGRNGALYRLGGGPAERLTDPESIDLSEGAGELLVCASGDVLALHRTRGDVELVSVSTDGKLHTIVGGHVVIGGFDVAGDAVVVSYSDAKTKGDIGVVGTSGITALTDFSAGLRGSGVAPIVELTVPARDGTPIHGWVLAPKGAGPHPVLLNIHGGPFTQYTAAFFDETQIYVDAGYAVVMCNPRGAAGYGEEFGRAIRHRMGTVDFTDVLDFLDGALEANPAFDKDRLGIMGGSYGGYLTAWTISQDHRFTAAIVERGYLDPEVFVGTSDIGDFFSDEYTGADAAQIRAQSPQAFVHQVTTPTLVLHSENDLRCPLSQGQRYYLALKRQGVDAEMLIFPGENHELSRSGRPRHRVQRFDAVLDWWERHLPVRAS